MHLISICSSVSLSLSLYSSVWPACYLSLSASTCLSLSVCFCLCIRIRACLLRGSGEVGCMVQPSFFQCLPWMTDRLRPRSPSPIYSKLISIKKENYIANPSNGLSRKRQACHGQWGMRERLERLQEGMAMEFEENLRVRGRREKKKCMHWRRRARKEEAEKGNIYEEEEAKEADCRTKIRRFGLDGEEVEEEDGEQEDEEHTMRSMEKDGVLTGKAFSCIV